MGPRPAPLAATAGGAKARRDARNGHGRRSWTSWTKGWRTQSWAAAAEADEPAGSPANDHDGQARHATSADGWRPAGAASAELQVHSNCSQPPSPGDARADGRSRRRSSPAAGAEADAWRAAVPAHPA